MMQKEPESEATQVRIQHVKGARSKLKSIADLLPTSGGRD